MKIANGADVAVMSRGGILLKMMMSFIQVISIVFSIPPVDLRESHTKRQSSFLESFSYSLEVDENSTFTISHF
jgi:hypothetical protein